MSKLRSSLIIFATVSFVTSVAHAELFSFQNTQTSQTEAEQSETPEPSPPLSAGDFKTQVAVKGQKAQQQLFQQTQSQMPMAQPKPPQLNQQQNATRMPADEQNQTSAKPAETTAPGSTQTTVTTTTTAPTPAGPPVLSTPSAAAAPPAPVEQGQAYTGFSGGTTNNTTTVPSSQPSSGWNVKY